MFFNSKDFKALEAGVRLSALQQELSSQNIANISTPGYKSKEINFAQVLTEAGENYPSTIGVNVVESDALSLLPDGNNVDLEKESMELYKAYVQNSMLLTKIRGEFDNFSYVLNNAPK